MTQGTRSRLDLAPCIKVNPSLPYSSLHSYNHARAIHFSNSRLNSDAVQLNENCPSVRPAVSGNKMFYGISNVNNFRPLVGALLRTTGKDSRAHIHTLFL